MFTGIIEEIGTVQTVRKGRASSSLSISGTRIFEDLKVGDSVAVNGVCLTVSAHSKHTFDADIMHETLKRSDLGALKQGSKVNLERALSAHSRFGGHIVSGHIDGCGTIKRIIRDDNALWFTIAADKVLLRYLVNKGSVTLDGISLTVATTGADVFCVSVIPHTAKETILNLKREGDIVNIETDIVGKYVERLLMLSNEEGSLQRVKEDGSLVSHTNKTEADCSPSALTSEFLIKHGF